MCRSYFKIAASILLCASVATTLQSQQAPFHRGVNLTNWFQASSARGVQYTKYSKQDFENIRSLGFDVVRLPINLHYMTYGPPGYVLDNLFLENLNQVADWAEELQVHLIFDNHTFSVEDDTDPQVGTILNKVWKQMAIQFADRSEYIYYEVLNEPHGIADAIWNNIQKSVVETIRQHDTIHYIIIGPAGWNSYHNLSAMPVYDDEKLIYTFHFYDPFLFTHQGSTWNTPSMADVENIPFPYDAGSMPARPPVYAGTWVGDLYNSYPADGTVEKVRDLIDIAVQFREQRDVPIFCGEFGVYQPTSQEVHRVNWYRTVSQYLDSMDIAWTMWDYHGGFGLFEENTDGMFEHDLNIPLLEALEAVIPQQSEYVREPDSTGFILYDDYLSNLVREASYTDGILDYYSRERPNNGKYCIHWTGASQYNAIVLDLHPDRDMSRLVSENYALDLMVRGDDPGISFDIRFLDSKTDDPDDLPWRMGITVNQNMVSFDNEWHHLHIPLKNLVQKGAWYDNTWYNPPGDYDWSDVDRLEIVPEQHALGQDHLWFDNIHITNLDTAKVNPQVLFTRGVNFNNWFQEPNAGRIQYYRYTEKDFQHIRDLGFDAIRLPLSLHSLNSGGPDYTLDTLFLQFLDHAVDLAGEHEIYLVLDNHSSGVFSQVEYDPETMLKAVWGQMAERYADRSEYISYEILNEPHNISEERWDSIQGRVIELIRETDTTHYILVDPAGRSSYKHLDSMTVYEDKKLIYTFHFYDPFIFTHQDASWTIPPLTGLKDIRFPYMEGSLPELPPAMEGTWVEEDYDRYPQEGNVQQVKDWIDIAAQFREQHKVPLYCGEFGVYQPPSTAEDRILWYRTVREQLEENSILWTTWDYQDTYGLFEQYGNDMFDHDLNIPLLAALDASIPGQTAFQMVPDTSGFLIYDDWFPSSFHMESYTAGYLDYYSVTQPYEGKYCIHWTGAEPYDAIVCNMKPDHDMTFLEENDFALDMMVRGSHSSLSFEVRFSDSKTSDPEDLPWRMGYYVDSSLVTFDGTWQNLHIPLSDFYETATWYGEWHDPAGQFDWSDINHFEIALSATPLDTGHLWFDRIRIEMDTVVTGTPDDRQDHFKRMTREDPFHIGVYPNPAGTFLRVVSNAPGEMNTILRDMNGRAVLQARFTGTIELDISGIRSGMYVLTASDPSGYATHRKVIIGGR
jgi:endoglucanase